LSEARPAAVAGAVPERRESRAESAGTTSPAESCAARCGDHFGVQVESPAVVVRELARVKAAGLPVREEMGVSCCHANQDKFWVQDPDGVEWEVYHLNFDVEGPASTASPSLAILERPSNCCSD